MEYTKKDTGRKPMYSIGTSICQDGYNCATEKSYRAYLGKITDMHKDFAGPRTKVKIWWYTTAKLNGHFVQHGGFKVVKQQKKKVI